MCSASCIGEIPPAKVGKGFKSGKIALLKSQLLYQIEVHRDHMSMIISCSNLTLLLEFKDSIQLALKVAVEATIPTLGKDLGLELLKIKVE